MILFAKRMYNVRVMHVRVMHLHEVRKRVYAFTISLATRMYEVSSCMRLQFPFVGNYKRAFHESALTHTKHFVSALYVIKSLIIPSNHVKLKHDLKKICFWVSAFLCIQHVQSILHKMYLYT